jgi:hypothetical protein
LIMFSISVVLVGLLWKVVYLNFFISFTYCEDVSVFAVSGVFLFCT